MKRLILVVVVLVVSLGCNAPELKRLDIATDAYATSVESMSDARQIGLIDDEEAVELESYRSKAWDLLQAWRLAILSGRGRSTEDAVAQALDVLWLAVLEARDEEDE